MGNTQRPQAQVEIGGVTFTAHAYAVGREALRVQEATESAKKEGKSDAMVGSDSTKTAFEVLQVACSHPEAAGKVGGDLYEWVLDNLPIPDTAALLAFVTERVSGKN